MRKVMSVTFRLFCIRHGETAGNKEKWLQGSMDIPLSEIGLDQAKEAAKALSETKFNRVYCSPLSRAKVTCEKIIEGNKHTNTNLCLEPRLRERNFGIVEGQLITVVCKLAAEVGKTHRTYTAPGGETPGEVQERVVAFFKELCQSVLDNNLETSIEDDAKQEVPQMMANNPKESECILVVAHGHSLSLLFVHLWKNLKCEGLDNETASQISPNTGISEFIVEYSPNKYNLKCIRLHDGDHLHNIQQSV